MIWMIIPDDRGYPHLAILNKIYPKEGRDAEADIGDDVKLLLYTRYNFNFNFITSKNELSFAVHKIIKWFKKLTISFFYFFIL